MTTRLPLDSAIASILGKKEHDGYRDIGQNMKVKDLRKILGLTATPMIYNYMSGKTKRIDPERALVVFETFGILIDDWLTSDELKIDATNSEISNQIASEPLREIMDDILEAERASTFDGMKRKLRLIIARYY